MKTDAIKEQIKLSTEWLRLYFIVMLTDASGSAALAIRLLKEQYATGEAIAFILSVALLLAIFLLLFRANNKINQLIKQLNNTNNG